MSRISPEFIRLACLYGAIFIVNGIQLPFWPVWLESRGMGPWEIGILSGALYWAKAVTNPTIGTIIDTRGNRIGMMRFLAATSLIISLFYLGFDGFWGLLIIGILGGSLFSGITPVAETISMGHATRGKIDYGRVRLWGSISFMVAAYLVGKILDYTPNNEIILWLFLGGLGITLAATWFSPDSPSTDSNTEREPWSGLLRDRRFLVFLVFAACAQGSHAVYYAFGTLHWTSQGVESGVIGGLWAVGVLAEIVLFAASARFVRRMDPAILMVSAGIAGVIRWPLMAFTTALPVLVLLQVLHAFTFGAAHLAAMHYITANTRSGLIARAQTVYSAVAVGLGSGILMIVAGRLYELLEGWAYLAMAGLSAFALVSAAFLAFTRHQPETMEQKKQELREEAA
ncbi:MULTISPECIES: 3-phenylpropionate MFS transporter [unclassified Haematospirillum]|uniref:3-phenylpropionate MFS transporter n=1 Tax=unclassified Haematospirillum TaxID=2622088 RepID=UPI00143A3832|nr:MULTISPECIES: 3-phenylpropionate MFS transporter [unclassified Haematospirillum]NKD54158.1 3-phenylpropionate MFS transporter [Haematospirillum sp. H4890]NKD74203.1 3-phenylpropionate MFS transporter [Haematospirillum sp. H4485]